MTRTIAFRTTCTEAVGFGHLRRCLTLAQEIARTARVVFVLTADERGRALAATCGFPIDVVGEGEAPTLAALESLGPDGVVIDDYALTSDVVAAIHRSVPRLLAIDDLADRRLEVDAVLNANPTADASPYDVPATCVRLFGPSYALLRPEFRDRPRRDVGDAIERVLVTLGGSNPDGRTEVIATALLEAFPAATVEVVAGPLFRGDLPAGARLVVHRSPTDMVELMTRADLAVAAGGQTTYELAACGVPAIGLCVADNQRANLDALAAAGTLRAATDTTVVATAVALAADRAARRALADAGQRLVDGRGAERAWAALGQRWFGGHA